MSVTIQRPLRGSRISSFYPIKNLPSLSSLDSAFQLQEYISLLIRLDVHDVDTIVAVPGKPEAKDKPSDSEEKVSVDEACWIYEHLRRLAQDLSHPLITMLQQECNRSSCPEMKAGEWLYLCVAHGNDAGMEQCCAIDYILHTLDSATALLNSPRAFPSRLQIPPTSHRHFSSLARRLGRIFAHAYFHHREVFEQAEAESSLHARFLALTSKFDLVPAEFLVIPPRIMHNENEGRDADVEPPRLLGAAVDPQITSKNEPMNLSSQESSGDSGDRSRSPLGSGSESPRKVGRNRTDTMVFSDSFSVTEEITKVDDDTGAIDTIVLSEGAASAKPPDSDEKKEPESGPADVLTEESDITVESQDIPQNVVTPSSSTAPQESSASTLQVTPLEPEVEDDSNKEQSGEPLIETPPAETPPAETPSAETPSAETPSVETPAEAPPLQPESQDVTEASGAEQVPEKSSADEEKLAPDVEKDKSETEESKS